MNQDADLPVGWLRVALGEVCSGIEKTTPLLHDPNKEFKYVDIESIDNHKLEVTVPKTLNWRDAPSRAQQIIKTNDTLFSTVRPYLRKIAFINSELNNQIASTGFCVIRPCIVNPKFVFYWVSHQAFVDAVSKLQQGTSYPAVRNSDILDQPILLPPFAEQNRLVTRLELLLEELDQTEASLQQAKGQVEEYRRAVLEDAFSGKLTGSILAEGELPEAWELMPLSNVGKWSGGGTPPKNEPKFWTNGDVLWVSPKDMKTAKIFDTEDKITRDALDSTSVKLVEENSVLFVVRSGILKRKLPIAINEKEVTLNQDMLAFTPNKDFIKTELVYWFMIHQSAAILANCSKSGMIDSIDTKLLRAYEIVVPPIKIQDDVLIAIQNEFRKISETENALDNQLSQTQSLRQTLFQDAFSGKLLPKDPTDEPATQLLERIKTEKIYMAAEQKQRDIATREAKKTKVNEPEVLKTIMQVLEERGGVYPAASVWRECEHKGDIDKFYAELKILMDSDNKVSEDQEKQNLFLVL